MKKIVKKRIEPLPTKAKIGRPPKSFDSSRIRELMLRGASVSDIQSETGMGRGTAHRAVLFVHGTLTPSEIATLQKNRRHRNLREI